MQPEWPAKQGNPGRSSSLGQGNGLWPHSPAMRVRTGKELTAHDDTSADAGAENDAEHDLCARPRAVGRFGQRKTVGVVGDADLAAEQRFQVGLDRLRVEAHRVGAAQQSGRARDRARRADADSAGFAKLGLRVAHERRDRVENAVVVRSRRDAAAAQQLAAVGRQRDDLDLGPAEVDADPEHVVGASVAKALYWTHARIVRRERARQRNSHRLPSG